jgi:hypothetical protein
MLFFIIVINVTLCWFTFYLLALFLLFPPIACGVVFTSVDVVCLLPYLYAMVMRSGERWGRL